jgi:hypothetical protein
VDGLLPFCRFTDEDGTDGLGGDDDVKVKDLFVVWPRQDWWFGEGLLEMLKGPVTLLGPFECGFFPQEFEKGERVLSRFCDKTR